MNTQWPTIRDIILFLGGMGGVVHETILTGSERPTLLILFAAMMGLPAFLRADEKKDPPPPYWPQYPPQQVPPPEKDQPEGPSNG